MLIKYIQKTGQIIGLINCYGNPCSAESEDGIKLLDLEGDQIVNLDLDRVYENNNEIKIVKKPYVQIQLTKDAILSNSIDETQIIIIIFDCQENETFDSITLSIIGQTFNIPLTNNTGSIQFSCKVPGKYQFKANDPMFRTNVVEVLANEPTEQ